MNNVTATEIQLRMEEFNKRVDDAVNKTYDKFTEQVLISLNNLLRESLKMSKPDYIRDRNRITKVSDCEESETTVLPSINKAKRESRKLQAAGNVVRIGKV